MHMFGLSKKITLVNYKNKKDIVMIDSNFLKVTIKNEDNSFLLLEMNLDTNIVKNLSKFC